MPDARPRGNPLLAAVLVATVLVVTGYVATAQPRVVYAIRVEDALAEFSRYRERRVRIHGVIVPGSLVKRGCDAKFKLAGESADESASGTLWVHYAGCDLPDALCDLSGAASSDAYCGAEVRAQGQLFSRNGRVELEAKELLVMYADKSQGPLFCARYRPGDDCPICEQALNARQRRSLSHPM